MYIVLFNLQNLISRLYPYFIDKAWKFKESGVTFPQAKSYGTIFSDPGMSTSKESVGTAV